MANTQTQSFIQNLIGVGGLIVGNANQQGILNKIDLLVAEWNLIGIGNKLQDSDVQSLFPYLNAQNIIDAVTALEAIQTALGDKVSGQQTNLIKVQS